MTETHIAHAVATFSELGIATGIVWLGDVVEYRSNLESDLIIAEESLRVTTADYHAKADGFDGVIRTAILIWMSFRKIVYTLVIRVLLAILRWSPYICTGLGIYALIGISFYPVAPVFIPSFISFSRENLDLIYFGMAFLSFMAICIPLIPKITKAIINQYVLKNIKIE